MSDEDGIIYPNDYKRIIKKEEWLFLIDNFIKDCRELSARYALEISRIKDEETRVFFTSQLEGLREMQKDYQRSKKWAEIEEGHLIFYIDSEGIPCFYSATKEQVKEAYKRNFYV